MKKLIILFAACLMAVSGIGQDAQFLDVNHGTNSLVRYKLYPTMNTSIFLKLDTRTGSIYQVHIPLDAGVHGQAYIGIPIDSSVTDTINGRYELYPTDHHWNFLLVD